LPFPTGGAQHFHHGRQEEHPLVEIAQPAGIEQAQRTGRRLVRPGVRKRRRIDAMEDRRHLFARQTMMPDQIFADAIADRDDPVQMRRQRLRRHVGPRVISARDHHRTARGQ
jgi:hypothetical protein